MELRHLRCFVVLAEELHFTRAAERLHIEQAPLSRTIKELEEDLGILLFARDRRGTRLTRAGDVFLQDIRRLFAIYEQARSNVKALAAGYRGSLRIAISDGAIDTRMSEFLAHCREEEPEIEIRLFEVPLAEQIRGLRDGDFCIGFAHTADVGYGITAHSLWSDALVAVIPARHTLLAYKEVPLDELARHPLIMCDPRTCEGYCKALTRLLEPLEQAPNIIEHVQSSEMMHALVAAGYGIGFTSAARMSPCRHPDIVIRPLAVSTAVLTTYLLWMNNDSASTLVKRYVSRLLDYRDE